MKTDDIFDDPVKTVRWMHCGEWSDVHAIMGDVTAELPQGRTLCGMVFYGWTPKEGVEITCATCLEILGIDDDETDDSYPTQEYAGLSDE